MNTAINDLLEHSFSIIKEKLQETLQEFKTTSASFELVEAMKEVQFLEGVLTGYGLLGTSDPEPSTEVIELKAKIETAKTYINAMPITNTDVDEVYVILNK